MSNVKIAIGLRRETGMHTSAVFPFSRSCAMSVRMKLDGAAEAALDPLVLLESFINLEHCYY
jgi:hypothetical protein